MAKTIRNNNWVRSAAINAVIAVTVILCTRMVYETNDDYAVASRIVGGYPEIVFMNYYFCDALSAVQSRISGLNVFVVTQLTLSFLSFFFMLKLLLDKCRDTVSSLLAVSLVAVLSIDAYCTIQFSKSAVLACLAAAMLLTDAVINKRGFGYYLAGVVMLYAGSMMRVDVLIVAIAFAGLYFLKWMAENRSGLREYFGAKQIVVYIVLVIAVAGCYAVKSASNDAIRRTPELQAYYDYNFLRAEVIDTTRLNHYEEQKEEYDAAGLSENDIGMIRSWVFDYDGAASSENLQAIIDISDGYEDAPSMAESIPEFISGTAHRVKELTPSGARVIILTLLALTLLIAGGAPARVFVIAAGLATAVFHVYLCSIGRPVNRALFTPDVCAMFFLMYALADARGAEKARKVMGVLTIIAAMLLIVPTARDAESLYEKIRGRIMSEELASYIREHSDSFYAIATMEKKSDPSYLTPLRTPDTEGERNFMGTGSWGTMSPYLLDKLGAYGMRNPVSDLIDNDHAYYMGNNNIEDLTEYYNKWYGGDGRVIRLEQVDEAGGVKVWKVISGEA